MRFLNKLFNVIERGKIHLLLKHRNQRLRKKAEMEQDEEKKEGSEQVAQLKGTIQELKSRV